MNPPKKLFPCRDEVAIDANHIHLISSLVMCSKPKTLLELGIGSGATTNALLEAMAYNQNGAELTCVDNFVDWGGVPPEGINDLPCQLITQSEREFVMSCQDKFQFIMSDADHDHSHEWADKTLGLLDVGGIAVFHDTDSDAYPNLRSVVEDVRQLGWSHVLLNKSSRGDERCERGLLVVFKP